LDYLYWAYATGAGYGDYDIYFYYGYYSGEYDGVQLDGPYYYEFGWGYFVYGEYVAYTWWWSGAGYFHASDSDGVGALYEYFGYGSFVVYNWWTGDAAWTTGYVGEFAGYGYGWDGEYGWFYSYGGDYDLGIYHAGSVIAGTEGGLMVLYGGDDLKVDEWLVDKTFPWIY